MAKAWAWLSGRPFVTSDEVKAVVKPTFRHRIQLKPEAELEGATSDRVLDGLVASVRVPRSAGKGLALPGPRCAEDW